MEVLRVPTVERSGLTYFGRYRCACGHIFEEAPDRMSAVACPACGREADAFNGHDFAPRSMWGEETGEQF